jgi:rare lipoprotein A
MKQTSIRAAAVFAVFWFAGCQRALAECGFAGAYAPTSRTARTDSSNLKEILGVHRSLPPGTRVVVRNQQKGRSIIVRILGPALSSLGEIIDLSAGAMHALGMEAPAPVCLEVLTYGSRSRGYEKLTGRNALMQASRPGKLRYTKAGGRTRLARERRHTRKAHARHRGGKRYAKLHRRGRAARRSGRRRRSAARG